MATMSRQEILNSIVGAIGKIEGFQLVLPKGCTDVLETHSFFDDLGLDSLSALELIAELEKTFPSSISDDDTEKIRTVGDAVTYIERHLSS
jgi:acyl carrier protein